jgi:hypothetical protein
MLPVAAKREPSVDSGKVARPASPDVKRFVMDAVRASSTELLGRIPELLSSWPADRRPRQIIEFYQGVCNQKNTASVAWERIQKVRLTHSLPTRLSAHEHPREVAFIKGTADDHHRQDHPPPAA